MLVELNRYVRKEMIARSKGLSASAKQTDENIKPLLDLLIRFDKAADEVDLLKKEGEDLFPIVFKLCFYNDLKYCISNTPLNELKISTQ